ncbi:MAG: hypothetical protein IJF07_00940 [Lachnospiraceae bacterium]|nr:hypothetical protein [Lachnospiraceae bacterium]
MDQGMEFRQQMVQEYKQSVLPLLKYLPWLEKNTGKAASTIYGGQDIAAHSVSFPVYDATLMSFVKEASASSLMDRNYRYVYTRNHIQDHGDERHLIRNATWREWNLLKGILSRYVLEGRSKGRLWSEAVEEEIFYLVLKQMKEIIEYWDKPLDL